MALRSLTGGGAQLPFVVVAAITLAVFLLGWRGSSPLSHPRPPCLNARPPAPEPRRTPFPVIGAENAPNRLV